MTIKLTNKQLYDFRDIDRGELKLIRVGHCLWAMLRKCRKSRMLHEERPLLEAIETIIRLKREYRAELKIKRAAESAAMRERFKRHAG